MARIKGRTREATREAALEAATTVFADAGYSGGSLHQIATRAGVTPAALSYHFGDKQGLYDAVVDRIYGDVSRLARELDLGAPPAVIVEAIFAFAEVHRDAVRVLIRGIMEGGGLDWKLRERRVGPTTDMLAHLIARTIDRPVPAVRRAVVALVHLVTRFVTNRPEDNRIMLGAASVEAARVEILALVTDIACHLLDLDPDRPLREAKRR